MDLTNVPKHVYDIANKLGYESSYKHDGKGHIFHLKSKEGKQKHDFSLSDEDAVRNDIVHLEQAIKEKVLGNVEAQNAEEQNKAKTADSKAHEKHAEEEKASLDEQSKQSEASKPVDDKEQAKHK